MSATELDAAIARAAAGAQERFVAQVQLSAPGRVALLDLPADISDQELIGFVGSLLTTGRGELIARRRGPRSRLLVPVG